MLPHAKGFFATPSGKCEFFVKASESNSMSPLPEYHPVAFADEELKKYPLQLLAIKFTRNFLNTSHANVGHLLKKEGTPYLDLHNVDAKARGIADGDPVKVYNQRGQVILAARIVGKVRQSVACMPQGFWSSLMKGGSSANALTSDLLTDMGDGSALQEARVEVTRL